MTSLLIVHVPSFIRACITLSFEVQIQNRLLHADLKTQGYHAKAFFQTLQEHQDPQEPLRTQTDAVQARTHLTLHQ